MIYTINCGHCVSGFDTGAVGNGLKEQDLTRLVGNLVRQKLKLQGHTVIDCTVDSATSVTQALNDICAKANAVKADMFISIHFNASNGAGHGVEVFTYGSKEIKEARNILNNIVGLGYTNRGIKDGKGLAVIKNTNAPAMLIECCFIDNAADMKMFNAEDMANAIVKGLTGKIPELGLNNFVESSNVSNVSQTRYCLEFQRWYNSTTKTTTPLKEDGLWGGNTENAYKILGKLMRGEY
jgi:N-acetylmuramoyl-L-alanine amidase